MILVPGWILLCTGLVLRSISQKKNAYKFGTLVALWGLGVLALWGPLGQQGLIIIAVLSFLHWQDNSSE